jgi:hypothetical protein
MPRTLIDSNVGKDNGKISYRFLKKNNAKYRCKMKNIKAEETKPPMIREEAA